MFNFENIGRKIKTLAVVTTITGIVISFIYGLLYIKNNSASMGLLIIILGCIISWISAFFIYGFGELIDKATEIAENTKKETINVNNEQEDKKSTDN